MSTISIIAAIADNNAIGKNQQLLWHLPADMKHFKELTTGHAIIMGSFLEKQQQARLLLWEERHSSHCPTVRCQIVKM